MKLSDLEKKVLMLAMDAGASDGEIAACASKFIHSLRKRYKSGVELIKDLAGLDEAQQPMPAGNPFQKWQSPFGPSMTRPFGQAPPNPVQPKRQYGYGADSFDSMWQEILRQAAQQANAAQQYARQQHATAFAAQAAANAHAQTQEHQEWARAQLKKKPKLWEKLFGG